MADMMTKIITVENFRASLNFINVFKGKTKNELLGGIRVKSQKGGKKLIDGVEANFYMARGI